MTEPSDLTSLAAILFPGGMNMEATVKCKKCGRVLKNPLSIAMGMGLKCAGIFAQGQKFHTTIRHSSGNRFSLVGTGAAQMPLIPSQPSEKRLSRKEMARRQREERRRLFEQRQSFQCGRLVRSKAPLQYEPVGEREWKDSVSGRIISHEYLQDYLKRYRFI
jgi:hypothetical protein